MFSSVTGADGEPRARKPVSDDLPLVILAFFAMALGLIGTPAWPWFRSFLEGRAGASTGMALPSRD